LWWVMILAHTKFNRRVDRPFVKKSSRKLQVLYLCVDDFSEGSVSWDKDVRRGLPSSTELQQAMFWVEELKEKESIATIESLRNQKFGLICL